MMSAQFIVFAILVTNRCNFAFTIPNRIQDSSC